MNSKTILVWRFIVVVMFLFGCLLVLSSHEPHYSQCVETVREDSGQVFTIIKCEGKPTKITGYRKQKLVNVSELEKLQVENTQLKEELRLQVNCNLEKNM